VLPYLIDISDSNEESDAEKCHFVAKSVKYMGYVITKDGNRT